MSTLAYAAFTTLREKAQPNTSFSTSPPGVGTYVDALAALVPAEVLTLHALILSVTTKTVNATTQIVDAVTLRWAFWGLILLSLALYLLPRALARRWDKLDFLRMLIPPLAFAGWTMIQRATAFDALFPNAGDAPRTVIALFLAVILGVGASLLAYQADQKTI
jgi:hypothetical protein